MNGREISGNTGSRGNTWGYAVFDYEEGGSRYCRDAALDTGGNTGCPPFRAGPPGTGRSGEDHRAAGKFPCIVGKISFFVSKIFCFAGAILWYAGMMR
jgi:hypothetical protein